MLTCTHVGGFCEGPEAVLQFECREVARLCRRLDDTWYAVLKQHLDHDCKHRVNCTSYERGRAGVDLWAERHRERIAREHGSGRRHTRRTVPRSTYGVLRRLRRESRRNVISTKKWHRQRRCHPGRQGP